MEPKDFLRQVVDYTIKGETGAANQAFKRYIVPKSMQVLGLSKEETETAPPKIDDTEEKK